MRRSKEEILAEVLRSATKKSNKSRIMHDSFLNYTQLEKYLAYALGVELIKKEGNLYTITSKGLDYLKRFDGSTSARDNTLARSLR